MLVNEDTPAPPLLSKTTDWKKYDLIILPLLSLTVVCLMFAAAEVAARIFFVEAEDQVCLNKRADGDNRMKANCTERLKNAEGPWVTYHYNACGYRGDVACSQKPAHVMRIALIGSSITQGLYVPNGQTFGERAAAQISERVHFPVEVQNMGVENLAPYFSVQRIDDALALHPDVIVYPIATYDLQLRMEAPDASQLSRLPQRRPVGPLKRLQGMVNEHSRAVLAAQHFFFANPANYFRIHVQYGDSSGLLQQPLSPDWQARFDAFERLLRYLSSRARAAETPLVIMAVPSRSQAILLDGTGSLPHVDPFAFGTLIHDMAGRVGCLYADAFSEFSRTPRSDSFFYPIDLHPDAQAHELLARALAAKCLDGSVPAFSQAAGSQRLQ